MDLDEAMANPSIASDAEALMELDRDQATQQKLITELYERWEELESRNQS